MTNKIKEKYGSFRGKLKSIVNLRFLANFRLRVTVIKLANSPRFMSRQSKAMYDKTITRYRQKTVPICCIVPT